MRVAALGPGKSFFPTTKLFFFGRQFCSRVGSLSLSPSLPSALPPQLRWQQSRDHNARSRKEK